MPCLLNLQSTSFFIEVLSIYSVALVSDVQHGASAATHVVRLSPALVQLLSSVNILMKHDGRRTKQTVFWDSFKKYITPFAFFGEYAKNSSHHSYHSFIIPGCFLQKEKTL